MTCENCPYFKKDFEDDRYVCMFDERNVDYAPCEVDEKENKEIANEI